MGMPLHYRDGMTRAEFRDWAARQPDRYELIDGEPVAMAPERRSRGRMKFRVGRFLEAGLRSINSSCEAFVDGLTVEIGDDGDFIPDVVIDCGKGQDDDIAACSPVVVIEVLSPSTSRIDLADKLAGYFKVPSIAHYLIVDPDRPRIIHHWRKDDGTQLFAILSTGCIDLTPPGITLDIDRLYAEAE